MVMMIQPTDHTFLVASWGAPRSNYFSPLPRQWYSTISAMISVPMPVQQRYNSYSIANYYIRHALSPQIKLQLSVECPSTQEFAILEGNISQFFAGTIIKSQLIMIASGCASLRTLINCVRMQGSFYKTVAFFKEVQGISGTIQKQKAINNFRDNLGEVDLKQFDALMTHINKKVKIGITTKVVNNYYLKKFPPQTNINDTLLLELAEGGLANKVSTTDKESELSLYDVNLFLRYIAGVSGTGSQGQKSQKIIDTVTAISKQQGIYFLKLIDHKITIGAKEKTFNNAKKTKVKVNLETKTEST